MADHAEKESNAPHPSTPQHVQAELKSTGRVYSLQIRQQPQHVFPEENFEIQFGLSEKPDSTDSPPTNVEIRATLQDPPEGTILQVLQEPRLSASRQVGKLVARISVTTTNRVPIRIRLDTSTIQGVVSSPIAVIEAKLQATPVGKWDTIWYKDEGGRDKCMELSVAAHDAQNRPLPVDGSVVLDLQYEGGARVSNQEILRVLGKNTALEKGSVKLRYRIEDVSKNHQGQNFVVQVRHDTRQDVAPCYSPAVVIRSKRNKRQKTSSSTMGSLDTSQRSDDDSRIREAVQGIIRWSDEVVNGIFPLQWQVMGYAQNPDGNPDYQRPYYQNMNCPNPYFQRILSIYNSSTREQLEYLRNTLDQPQPPSMGFDTPHYPMQYMPTVGISHHMSPAMPHHMGKMPARDFFPQQPQQPQAPPAVYEPAGFRESPPYHPSAFPDPFTRKDTTVGDTSESDESRVEFVLVKQYKSFSTGETLGFPAYSSAKDLLGFYLPNQSFRPVPKSFGPTERQDASQILHHEMQKKSHMVYALKDFDSMSSLLDHASVFDWKQDVK